MWSLFVNSRDQSVHQEKCVAADHPEGLNEQGSDQVLASEYVPPSQERVKEI